MSAMMFVILLVATAILGAYLAAYAAHVFLTIAQQTAGGLDEITWPKDPWLDWIGRALHLIWLVAFWVVPLGFVLRLIGPESLAASAALHLVVPAALFWLLFPVTLMSSFSANSPWVLLRPEALRRMVRCLAGTVGFYLATLPLCFLGAAALYVTLAHQVFYAMPVLATVLFLYARLVGRYSRLLGNVRPGGAKPVDKAVRRAARAAQVEDPWGAPAEEKKKDRPKRKRKKRTAQVHDPWAVPEDEPEEKAPAEEVETYGIAEVEVKPERRKAAQPVPRVEGYDVSGEEPPPQPKEVPLDGSTPIEAKRSPSESELPLPDRPLIDGVYTFPWYASNLPYWVLLTLLFLGWGYVYTTMQAVRPF
jgi:hypothetical protein